MRFIVQIPELDAFLYQNRGEESKHDLFQAIQKLEASGRLVEGGLLADDHGGFLLLEAESFKDLEETLSRLFNSTRYSFESHPILPFHQVATLLKAIKERKPTAKKEAPKEFQTLAV